MDTGSLDTPRWVQRFENFDRAIVLLRQAIELIDERGDKLEPELLTVMKEGAIQRFEYTFELAWKTLKDFLQFRQVTLDRLGPGDVIRAAFAAGYLSHGDEWMDALDARNEMSHVYRQQAFERVIGEIRSRFMARFEDLHEMLLAERLRLEDGSENSAE